MDAFWWLAIIVWAAAVSFAAAFIIRNRIIAVVTAVCASVFIPLALGLLFTSLYLNSPLGPEELLEKAFHLFIGSGTSHLFQTLFCMALGTALGFVAVWFVMRLRCRR
jgi:hypothetical protein